MAESGFERLLKETIGLDAAVIGSSAIDRAVAERQQACRLPAADAYWDHLRASESELQELIDAVIVPETWFFRDREAFAALAGPVVRSWSTERVLRLLSVPCSTGEEPYSIAMALLDAGLAPARFHIDAVDVSERALAKARRAVFGRSSFRGESLAFRDRYFDEDGNGWRLAPHVCAQVTFQQSNLLDAAFLRDAEPYDVIFCRNLLIYFDRPTQDRATAVLARLLAPDGFLFVGPSETGLLLAHQFPSTKLPLAFAIRGRRSTRNRRPAGDESARHRNVAGLQVSRATG
jgi:chemotaxis protein methyltransferase WspC